LATNAKYEDILKQHRHYLPVNEHPILGKESTGHRAFQAAEKKRVERNRTN
ncbi:unnamed protein product, partial [marine sediment metagenome]